MGRYSRYWEMDGEQEDRLKRAKSKPSITLAELCAKARNISYSGKTIFDIRKTVEELWRWEKLCRYESGEYVFTPAVIRDAHYYSRKDPGWYPIGKITGNLADSRHFPDSVIVSDMPDPKSDVGLRWMEAMRSDKEPDWISALTRKQYEKECEAHVKWIDGEADRVDKFNKARREWGDKEYERVRRIEEMCNTLWRHGERRLVKYYMDRK